MQTPELFTLAVYGSLRQGFHNHHLLAHCEYLGTFNSANRYTMVDLGSFPGLFHGNCSTIVVEIYRVDEDTLAKLDILEGHPEHYQRHPQTIEGFGEAWLYLMPEGYLDTTKVPQVSGGDWRAYRNA
ncbi:gamma-glutamylcyclotransferase family protein [Simiduia agarivorans]|uniref:Gamma-glutamylcyclotransferase family protein n=1 Tax=Simiduia agarivorans (strain DSM 21679 / JCM 13881 / BCRC 17597 / SA1) TaxID=1117647 RepID=K4KHC5_SIMAS|nr:gamma-glutamylcyclotransferase family protein [Simiduia agarivorans]AFU98411.1 BtrG [Simiduia agarivorans SA1 = DSM 21679]